MNERIKELELEAAYGNIDPNGALTGEEFNQFTAKFAELIVKECLMIVYERQVLAPTDDDGYFKVALDMVSKDIEQHFGVE